jgi:cell division protease FtsH
MHTQVTHLYQRGSNDQSPTGQQHSNNGSNSSNSGSPRNNNRQVLKFSLLILGVVLILWTIALSSQGSNVQQNVGELPYSAFYQQIQAGNVKDATFQGQDITGDFKNAISLNDANGNPVLATQYHLIQLPNGDPNLITLLNQNHVQYQARPVPNTNPLLSILVSFLPLILVIGVIFFISRRATKSQQNIFSFGKTRARVVAGDRPGTTFSDVAGVEEAKYDLVEVVEFLKTPEKFQRLGGKIPRGVLLVGPPGTGKTLLARAVAGEAAVPFFSMSGSEFVEVLVGVGASRVRDLFDQAKKAAPSIIFLDEIDAVGRQRGTSINSNDERVPVPLLVWSGRISPISSTKRLCWQRGAI